MTDNVDPNTEEPIEDTAEDSVPPVPAGADELETPEETIESQADETAAELDEPAADAGDLAPSEELARTLDEIEEALADRNAGGDVGRLQTELSELNNKHLRLAADYSNFRRRAETERAASWDRAQSDLLRHMLEALDDLQRVGGFEAENTTVESLVEGVDLVERKFRQALEAAGVEVIDPIDQPFDPNLMEGMMRVTTDLEEKDEFVQAVYQKGYSLNGHLVRPARVSVFKHG